MDQHLRHRVHELAEELGAAHRLGTYDSELLVAVHLAVALARQGDDTAGLPLDVLAAALDNERVLDATLVHIGIEVVDAGELRRIHELFAAVAAGAPLKAGPHVAVARCCEGMGDVHAMERALRLAIGAEPHHRLAHRDLGELAALRGDHRAARGHFEHAGLPAIGLSAAIANLSWGPVKGARNAACPCGSGSQYKRCCHQTEGWPLAARVALLPVRLGEWTERPVWYRRRLSFAAAAAGLAAFEDDPSGAVDAAFVDGAVELFLFDGGGLQRLLTEVGPLLRADEREVAAGWVHCRHDLYEVLECGPGHERLCAVRTGEVRVVTGVDVELLEGERAFVLAAVLPGVGRHEWVLGGEPIPIDERQIHEVRRALDADGDSSAVARAALRPALEFRRLVGDASPDDPGRDERLRWLFGEHVDTNALRRPGAVDDLVTTTYLRGGGMSEAADHIRWAGRQIAEGEPPEVWALAQALTAAGHDRTTILVHLAVAWYAATRRAPDPTAIHAEHLRFLRKVPEMVASERLNRRERRG